VRILVVDDHALVRHGIALIVKDEFPDADVLEADGAGPALEALRGGVADVALVDVRMPDHDGIELLKEIRTEWPDLPVIMLTTFDHARYARAALAEGAAGYMLKDSSPSDLGQAIRVATEGGGNVLSSKVIQNLFEEMERGGPHEAAPPNIANLTAREQEILQLLVEGQSNREISEHLYLSEKTVKAHLAAVFRKLAVSNRTQAAMAAVNMGMGSNHAVVDPEEDSA
jgi:two-component system, NarL family, response regulator DegU